MASSPITSWQIDGEKVKIVTDFIFLGSKITADGDCSHGIYEIKRYLLLGRKALTSLDSIFKSRDKTLPTIVHLVKALVSPVVMYGCKSWTVKKAEHQRIDAFELWYSQESSLIPQFKSINFLTLSFLYSPTLTSIRDHPVVSNSLQPHGLQSMEFSRPEY